MLFRAAVPGPRVALPGVLSQTQVETAQSAINDVTGTLLPKTELSDALGICVNPSPAQQREAIKAFQNAGLLYRSELMRSSMQTKPVARLAVHQAIMTAGYYENALNFQKGNAEARAFPVLHYNSQIKWDTPILKSARKYLLENPELETRDPEGQQVVSEMFQLERYLFGANRFQGNNSTQRFVGPIAMDDIGDDKAAFERIAELPAVRQNGNITVSFNDSDPFWARQRITCGEEETEPFRVDVPRSKVGVLPNQSESYYEHKIKIEKILTRRERVTNFLLRAWVMWISAWGMFWAVDEEIITFVALIIAKIKSMRDLETLAREGGGGKVYVTRAGLRPATAKRQYYVE